MSSRGGTTGTIPCATGVQAPAEANAGARATGRSRDRRAALARAAAAACALALAACSTSGFDLPVSAIPGVDARATGERTFAAGTGAEEGAPGSLEGSALGPYRIGAGDFLAVRFFFNPELNQDIRVQPDGAITLPLLGTREVSGMTLPELTEILRATFGRELRQPEVIVQLVDAAEQRVYVGGAVSRPQEVLYRRGLTPLDAVLSAGGFTPAARPNQVVLIRKDGNGNAQPAIVDLREMILRDERVVQLEPWDVVFVPKDEISKVGEWVEKHIADLLLFNGLSVGYDLNPGD